MSFSRDMFVYYAQFARIGGGVKAGLFLSYLFSCQGDPDGWIQKTQAQLEQETGLTRREQESARKQLVSHGLIEEERRGLPARIFFRPSIDAIIRPLP